MPISKHQILASLAAIEAHSPAYFGDMPVPDDQLRDIFASAMAGLSASPDFDGATAPCREAALLALLTHVMLDAAYLQHQWHGSAQRASREVARLVGRAAAH